LGADRETGTGPIRGLHAAERQLSAIDGIDLRILRPGYFLENFLANLGLIRAQGVNGGAIEPDVRFPMTAVRDIGAAAAEELHDRSLTGRSVRELLGPRDLSIREATAALGAALRNPELPYVRFPDPALAWAPGL